ncbi:MAG: hypothetical protein QNJ51_15270 [Calothrix sp. MO_167.B12]|nr:hypothetical protein [Calothrix sp. MO_167.B12]
MKHPFSLDITELESLAWEMTQLSNEEAEKVSGGTDVTTYAIGEEGGDSNPTVTTQAVGEEGGDSNPIATTEAVGEEGGAILPNIFPFPCSCQSPF